MAVSAQGAAMEAKPLKSYRMQSRCIFRKHLTTLMATACSFGFVSFASANTLKLERRPKMFSASSNFRNSFGNAGMQDETKDSSQADLQVELNISLSGSRAQSLDDIMKKQDVDSLWKYKNEQAEVQKQSKTVMETKKLAAVKNLDLQLHKMMNSRDAAIAKEGTSSSADENNSQLEQSLVLKEQLKAALERRSWVKEPSEQPSHRDQTVMANGGDRRISSMQESAMTYLETRLRTLWRTANDKQKDATSLLQAQGPSRKELVNSIISLQKRFNKFRDTTSNIQDPEASEQQITKALSDMAHRQHGRREEEAFQSGRTVNEQEEATNGFFSGWRTSWRWKKFFGHRREEASGGYRGDHFEERGSERECPAPHADEVQFVLIEELQRCRAQVQGSVQDTWQLGSWQGTFVQDSDTEIDMTLKILEMKQEDGACRGEIMWSDGQGVTEFRGQVRGMQIDIEEVNVLRDTSGGQFLPGTRYRMIKEGEEMRGTWIHPALAVWGLLHLRTSSSSPNEDSRSSVEKLKSLRYIVGRTVPLLGEDEHLEGKEVSFLSSPFVLAGGDTDFFCTACFLSMCNVALLVVMAFMCQRRSSTPAPAQEEEEKQADGDEDAVELLKSASSLESSTGNMPENPSTTFKRVLRGHEIPVESFQAVARSVMKKSPLASSISSSSKASSDRWSTSAVDRSSTAQEQPDPASSAFAESMQEEEQEQRPCHQSLTESMVTLLLLFLYLPAPPFLFHFLLLP
ncbi:hypothetical protein GUITHDRAFT_145821 [Guillardia theta CCMP2712]|uniref:Transmembrane protein n=1 Tax=Guillardia theta (strain CCMP2712) TaxID=905079 RepID=L1IKC2_GUITC|nr:hypothetical protein GUITHDRAFT_145821 [Guillardia theta CCMP2712]EKX36359.1 hypothetical protein GUITHDRAFT_145821 [Guillardia theta CCMP2712]|eukprot:XP_005823339.1 hypothetical protein GUITHDRAFT_145821 [Guillardia theta CCMP2712]